MVSVRVTCENRAKHECPFCKIEYADLRVLKNHVRKNHTDSCPVCGWQGRFLAQHVIQKDDIDHQRLAFLLLPRWKISARRVRVNDDLSTEGVLFRLSKKGQYLIGCILKHSLQPRYYDELMQPSLRPWKCPFCGIEYKTLYSLRCHAKKHKLETCPVCNKSFSNLIAHLHFQKDVQHRLLIALLYNCNNRASNKRINNLLITAWHKYGLP